MADVLGYLSEVARFVSVTLMPTEMEDVVAFLRGDAWVLVSAHSTQVSSTSTSNNSAATVAAEGEVQTDSHCSGSTTVNPASVSSTLLRYPLGATRWSHFIPLGIASTGLCSTATVDSRTVLLNFFESSGFAKVLTVNLVPTEQQQTSLNGVGGSSAHVSNGASSAFNFESSSSHPFPLEEMNRVSETFSSRKRKRMSNIPSSGCTSASDIVDVVLDGRYGTTEQAARHTCTAAVRRWLEDLEKSLRDEYEDDEKGEERIETARAEKKKMQLRRLLVIVRCCADSQSAGAAARVGGAHTASYSSTAATGRGITTFSSPLSFSTGLSGRRRRRTDDPLLLFLHDLAALTTLYDVRLASTACTVRPAVLLLLEDGSYGGAMLRQRLKEEVGYRYWVQLFLQSDQQHHQQRQQQSSCGGGGCSAGETASLSSLPAAQKTNLSWSWKSTLVGRSAVHRNVVPQPQLHHRQGEVPLVRGCRIAALWGVLDPAALSSVGVDFAGTCLNPLSKVHSTNGASLAAPLVPRAREAEVEGSREATVTMTHLFAHASAEQLERALRRHSECFFVRPANAPLCVFLMEALRRFPLLARPETLRHWQSTWTARHSLNDLIFVFHTTVCPFTVSAAQQDASTRNYHNTSQCGNDGRLSIFSSTLLHDAADLLDALLDAAFTLAEDRDRVEPLSSNDFYIEQAVLFMLMYEALVQQQEGRLRRMPGVVEVLLRLYDLHAGITTAPTTTSTITTTEERLRYAVRHLLPFAPLNVFYKAVQQRSAARTTAGLAASPQGGSFQRDVASYAMNSLVLPLRRMSVAPQLHRTTLLALLPPDVSLLELKSVSEKLWEKTLPESWQEMLQHSERGDTQTSTSAPNSINNKNHATDNSVTTSTQPSPGNFFHPLVPHAVRVLYLLTAHALHAPTEAAKQVRVVQLQTVCQLTDEQLLLVLKELQTTGLATTNLKTQTARTLLDCM